MNTELSEEEKRYYVEALKTARKIVFEAYADVSTFCEAEEGVIAAVFEKIASPLYFLRQGNFSTKTPTLNDGKVAKNENKPERGEWKQSKDPNIWFRDWVSNPEWLEFEDRRTGNTWLLKKEAKK